jgi:hypothetical protein
MLRKFQEIESTIYGAQLTVLSAVEKTIRLVEYGILTFHSLLSLLQLRLLSLESHENVSPNCSHPLCVSVGRSVIAPSPILALPLFPRVRDEDHDKAGQRRGTVAQR